jgi:Arm domain-containing DNA-binding protein
LRPKPKRYSTADPECIGLYIRVMPTAVKSFAVVVRDEFGKQRWITVGKVGHIGIEQAREQARTIIARVKAGRSPVEPPPPAPDSFATISQLWFRRHVEAKGLRTAMEIRRVINKYLLPHWGPRPFTEIRRSDTARLIDFIQDAHGSRMADVVLTSSIISASGTARATTSSCPSWCGA